MRTNLEIQDAIARDMFRANGQLNEMGLLWYLSTLTEKIDRLSQKNECCWVDKPCEKHSTPPRNEVGE